MSYKKEDEYKHCKNCKILMVRKEYREKYRYSKWNDKIFCNDDCRKKYRKQLMIETYGS